MTTFVFFSKAETGTLDEIVQQWSLELYHRHVRQERLHKVWYKQLNILQNKFRSFWHHCRNLDQGADHFSSVFLGRALTFVCAATNPTVWHTGAPGWQQMTWELDLDKEISQGMWEVIHTVSSIELHHVAARKGEDAKKAAEEYQERLRRERDEREAKRKEELARQEEEARLWKQKMDLEAAEREEKAKKDALDREVHIASAQMTIQAKIAAFQAACAQLTADLQAGKITGAEYGVQMAGLSKMMQ